ncbi:3-carboxyethylcatechol 2,3-dioxygenase [Rhizorhabdus histidinilytica]
MRVAHPAHARGRCRPLIAAAVRDGFSALAEAVRRFDPELIIQFSPDHFNGFFYDLMPSFCVAAAAVSIGDWGTASGPLAVPEEQAHALAAFVQGQDVDIALSYRMMVDHGTTQIWEEMFGAFGELPILPIFVNAIAPPLPSYRRARLLGEAVGRFAATTGRRVLFAASGGLSHDPPIPVLAGADPDLRARLIDGRNPSADARAARQARVRAAGLAAALGTGDAKPLNPAWDRHVLDLLVRERVEAFDRFDTAEVARVAGRAANETLAWIAAAAAHAVAGPSRREVIFYQPIDGWMAGMAMLFGTTGTGPAEA